MLSNSIFAKALTPSALRKISSTHGPRAERNNGRRGKGWTKKFHSFLSTLEIRLVPKKEHSRYVIIFDCTTQYIMRIKCIKEEHHIYRYYDRKHYSTTCLRSLRRQVVNVGVFSAWRVTNSYKSCDSRLPYAFSYETLLDSISTGNNRVKYHDASIISLN